MVSSTDGGLVSSFGTAPVGFVVGLTKLLIPPSLAITS